MPEQIIVLFLVYGNTYEATGIECLNLIVKRMFPSSLVNIIVIDNSLPEEYFNDCAGYVRIGGDNSLWEFSGWDRGIYHVNIDISHSDNTVMLFANDTFHMRNYKDGPNFLDVFDAPIVREKDVVNSAIGYLDDFPRNVTIFGIEYRSWIRSNIFFLPVSIVKQLYPFSKTIEPEALFSNDIKKFWSDTELISENWKAYISSWLFGIENPEYPEYSLHWLKAEPVNTENHEFFKKKALCILAEHYLTARLFDMGVPIIDTNIFEKKNDRHTSSYYK